MTDPSDAAIADATVEVKNTATQAGRTVTTNAQGHFTGPELFVGSYDVPVVLGGERVVDMTMKIGFCRVPLTHTPVVLGCPSCPMYMSDPIEFGGRDVFEIA